MVIGHPKNHLDYQAKSYEELCEAQRTHRATKTYEQFTATMSDEGREAAPDWFKSGVEAAMKAPSAMNRQPITFSYNPADDTAAAHIDQSAEDEHHAFNDMASPSCTSRSVPAKASGLGATVACSSISNLVVTPLIEGSHYYGYFSDGMSFQVGSCISLRESHQPLAICTKPVLRCSRSTITRRMTSLAAVSTVPSPNTSGRKSP